MAESIPLNQHTDRVYYDWAQPWNAWLGCRRYPRHPTSPYNPSTLLLPRLSEVSSCWGLTCESYVHKATESALDTMERGLVQMKDYQTARRKLESRRLHYDSVLSKVQKMRKEDVRTEEELRNARAKYEETSEDVHNRMMTIQEAEVKPPLQRVFVVATNGVGG
jgi:BAR domain